MRFFVPLSRLRPPRGKHVFAAGILGLALFWIAQSQVTQIPAGNGTAIPSGPAGGDLSGTYPNPTVAQVNGVAYPSAPSTNTVPVVTAPGVITYGKVPNAAILNPTFTVNGITCTLGAGCTVTAVPSGAAGGDLQGTYPNPTLLHPSVTVNGTTCTLGSTCSPSATPSGSAGGDLQGTYPNPTLLHPSTTVNGQTCTLGSTCTVTAVPSGSAGGDLQGTYPNPTLLHPSVTVNGTTCTLGSSCSPATGPAAGTTFGFIAVWTPASSVNGSATTNTNIFGQASLTGTEANSQTVLGVTCTAKNMTVHLANAGGSQPASGSLVFTLRVNGASPASGLVVTIPANTASPGTFQDTTHSVTIGSTDTLNYQVVNNATQTSVVFNEIAFTCY